MRTNRNPELIICPNCGAEYLPAEIYIPEVLIGKPKNIEKDVTTGRILDYMGTAMNTDEHYRCDHCDATFKVNARITFNSSIETNYNEDYSTKLVKGQLFLSEK